METPDLEGEKEQALKRGGVEYANGYVEGILDGFKADMKDNYIPLVESLIEKETIHLRWLISNDAPQYIINNWIESLQHLEETLKDYKQYITK